MAQTTANTSAFIDAQVYSTLILENLHDGLLPEVFYRNVSDFASGSTLNIKTVGSATIQDVQEDVAIKLNPIDTGTVTLTITDFIGDGWYVTDMLRQDGSQIDALMAMRAAESTRAIQEDFETKFLSACNAAQTAAAVNAINGFAHRWVADDAANNSWKMGLADFRKMKLSFDKANVPQKGRIALVDPVVEATLNGLLTNTTAVDANPQFSPVTETGFAMDHKFIMNLFGWDIYTSNRLPTITSEAIDASSYGGTSETVTGGVANIFMNVLDDSVKPMMAAWRQMPQVEGERNISMKRDEFYSSARFGIGAQRTDSLGIILTSASNY